MPDGLTLTLLLRSLPILYNRRQRPSINRIVGRFPAHNTDVVYPGSRGGDKQ